MASRGLSDATLMLSIIYHQPGETPSFEAKKLRQAVEQVSQTPKYGMLTTFFRDVIDPSCSRASTFFDDFISHPRESNLEVVVDSEGVVLCMPADSRRVYVALTQAIYGKSILEDLKPIAEAVWAEYARLSEQPSLQDGARDKK